MRYILALLILCSSAFGSTYISVTAQDSILDAGGRSGADALKNLGGTTLITVGNNQTRTYWAWFNFLNDVPSGATIDSAIFVAKPSTVNGTGTFASAEMSTNWVVGTTSTGLEVCASSWDSAGCGTAVNGATIGATKWTAGGGDFANPTDTVDLATFSPGDSLGFYVTSAVQAILDGTAYGIGFYQVTGTGYHQWPTADNGTAANRPRLHIWYTPGYTVFHTTDGVIPDSTVVYQTTCDSLDTLLANNPTWIDSTFGSGGQTDSGRVLRSIIISPSGYNKTVFISGGIHNNWKTKEQLSVMGALNFLGFCADSAASKWPLVRIAVAPMVNPDGAALNRRGNNNTSAVPPRVVDNNRNFKTGWGIDDYGGRATTDTTDPGAWNYAGPYPESEPETQGLVAYVNNLNPGLHVDIHGCANEIILCDSSDALEGRAVNRFLADNGFETLDHNHILDPGTGIFAMWSDSVGSKSFTYEYGDTSNCNIEEINRNVGAMIKLVDMYQLVPVINTVYSGLGHTVTIEWAEDNQNTDSVKILRDNVLIATVDDSTWTYEDTITEYGVYSYSLFAISTADTSDTSACYNFTLSGNDWGQWGDLWNNDWGSW